MKIFVILASLAASKPLTSSMQSVVKQAKSKLVQKRQFEFDLDFESECSFDEMLEGSCSLDEYCSTSELAFIVALLGYSYDCSGEVPDNFYIELISGTECLDSPEAVEIVGQEEYDRVNGYCFVFTSRDIFEGGTFIRSEYNTTNTEPATKVGSYSVSVPMVECEMNDDSSDYGNRSFCVGGCYEQVVVNDMPCSLESCLDCGGGDYTVDCSNVDPFLVLQCDDEVEWEAMLIRYYQSVNVGVTDEPFIVMTDEPAEENNGDNVTGLLFSTGESEISDTEMAVWDDQGNLLAENDDRMGDLRSEVLLEDPSLPAVYYIGGSQWATSFADNFMMSGIPFDSFETGTITFTLNGVLIGTKELGEQGTTGFPEFALFRVELDANGVIVSSTDESLVPPPSTQLIFSTFGSGIRDTEIGLWDENGMLITNNDDSEENSQSQITLSTTDLPTVYYVGGSAFNILFFDDFIMTGSALGAGQTGDMTFSLNDTTIGTTTVGDTATTGLSEYALFRVQIDADGEIESAEEVSPPLCSIADVLSGVGNCTLDAVCSTLGSARGFADCIPNEDGGLTAVEESTFCYESVSQVYDFGTVFVDDINAIPDGTFATQSLLWMYLTRTDTTCQVALPVSSACQACETTPLFETFSPFLVKTRMPRVSSRWVEIRTATQEMIAHLLSWMGKRALANALYAISLLISLTVPTSMRLLFNPVMATSLSLRN